MILYNSHLNSIWTPGVWSKAHQPDEISMVLTISAVDNTKLNCLSREAIAETELEEDKTKQEIGIVTTAEGLKAERGSQEILVD